MINDSLSALSSPTGKNPTKPKETDNQDRFLKVLIAQMKNQDPLSPLDNAQVTSQMAQISTVQGIDKLNNTMLNIGANMLDSQVIQGSNLLGRTATTTNGSFHYSASEPPSSWLTIEGPADQVNVEVRNKAGMLVKTISLGSKESGTHELSFSDLGLSDGDYTTKLVAKNGQQEVSGQISTEQKIIGIKPDGNGLQVQLRSGEYVLASEIAKIQ